MTPPIAQGNSIVVVYGAVMRRSSCTLCVWETQAPNMGALSTDLDGKQDFFSMHPLNRPAWQALKIPSLPCWRLVAGAVCTCSFHAPHVGVPVDVRVAFWRTLRSVITIARSVLLETPTRGSSSSARSTSTCRHGFAPDR